MKFGAWLTAVLVVGVVAGAAGAYVYVSNTEAKKDDDCTEKYFLTSDTVGCDEYEDSAATLQNLNEVLSAEIERYVAQGDAGRVSVWVRDLNTRQYASVSEFEKYAPASLYKVPIMIAYYKYLDIDASILSKNILFTLDGESENALEYFKTPDPIVPGTTYSVDELIERMIINSDNDAARLLAKNLNESFFKKVLIELGLVIPIDDQGADFVTVKTYANLYRALYNASYLNRDLSQKALELLERTKFSGIREPLPASVKVAHKFGERYVPPTGSEQAKFQLHDCGIIYKSDRTYTLCVMTEGRNFEGLTEVIKDISDVAYKNL